jgi:hypothetical protein
MKMNEVSIIERGHADVRWTSLDKFRHSDNFGQWRPIKGKVLDGSCQSIEHFTPRSDINWQLTVDFQVHCKVHKSVHIFEMAKSSKIRMTLNRPCRRRLFPQDEPVSGQNSPVVKRQIPYDLDVLSRPRRRITKSGRQFPMVMIPVDVLEEHLNIRDNSDELLRSPCRDWAVNDRPDETPEFPPPGSPELAPVDVMEDFLIN